ncbi:MAG TPA: ATP-dependent metallopeptidase FtsH/Yme1/Tma family protein [Firmicutes bacterium]|nr:ATP-dependent metallopeptidase FtsH/Yme1/Tma family protein [Bacillota bacterium]
MNKLARNLSLYMLIAILALSVGRMLMSKEPAVERPNFTQFMEYVNKGEVSRVRIIGEQTVVGQLRNGQHFQTVIPPGLAGQLSLELASRGVAVDPQEVKQPWWVAVLPSVIGLVIFAGFFLFILNQMQGGNNRALSFAKARAHLYSEEKAKVTFDDVAGVDEAKQELGEIVEFLKHPKRFMEMGAKIPKGVLLVGPPGTGKTLLAKAVAGEAGVPFFSISGSDFVEMFVGVGAARVRDLFDTAKKNSPCIVFIDELDAVGRHRGAGLGGGHDEREQTLNQLLVEMDGFEANTGVIVMAATNRPDVLDPALLRPGRFDRRVVVDRPDVVGREEILRIHARNKPLAADVDLKTVARMTPGFVGADLENLMNEAAILAARWGKKRITMAEIEEAVDRVLIGPERKRRVMTEREKRLTAFHEAGHAVVAYFLPHADPVHKVTIVGRGLAGGYTLTLPEEDRWYETRTELEERLAQMLGGRAAEELALGEVSTGAHNDLEQATKVARRMVTEYGMSEELGPLTFGRQNEDLIFLGRDIARDRNYSEKVAAAIDKEVRRLVETAHARAKAILEEHRAELSRVAEALLERETLSREEFAALMRGEALVEAAGHEAQAVAPERAGEAVGEGREKERGAEVGLPLGAGAKPKPAVGLQ